MKCFWRLCHLTSFFPDANLCTWNFFFFLNHKPLVFYYCHSRGCKSLWLSNVKQSVKLRVLHSHASDGLSDLTLREETTQTGRWWRSLWFYWIWQLFFFLLIKITRSWLIVLVSVIDHPFLLLALGVLGLDHAAPSLCYWSFVLLLLFGQAIVDVKSPLTLLGVDVKTWMFVFFRPGLSFLC